jgi:hypothetical protein
MCECMLASKDSHVLERRELEVNVAMKMSSFVFSLAPPRH